MIDKLITQDIDCCAIEARLTVFFHLLGVVPGAGIQRESPGESTEDVRFTQSDQGNPEGPGVDPKLSENDNVVGDTPLNEQSIYARSC